MTTSDKAEKLQTIGSYEGTEISDYWFNLTNVYLWQKDYMTEDFWLQIGLEIEIQYQYALDMIDDEDFPIKIPEELKGTLV